MLSSTIRAASRVTLLNRSTTLAAVANPFVANPFVDSVRYRSSRSRRGLYDGKDIRSGNNVSFSERKTKRKFKPNVFIKRVYSEVLDEMVKFHLTAATLRSIDKAGGLDNYLVKTRHATEGEGLVAKTRILERLEELEVTSTEVDSASVETNKTAGDIQV
jgi:large subunit ribosomal protein L28